MRVHDGAATPSMRWREGRDACRAHVKSDDFLERGPTRADGGRQYLALMACGYFGTVAITPDFVMPRSRRRQVLVRRREHLPAWRRRPAVLIGKDTRSSGYMIESRSRPASAAGVDVAADRPDADAGHRLPDARAAAPAGGSSSRPRTTLLRQRHQVLLGLRRKLPDGGGTGDRGRGLDAPIDGRPSARRARIDDAAGRYIEFCKSTFPNSADLRGLRIVIDARTARPITSRRTCFSELGAEVIAIGAAPDGLNINDEVGARAPQALGEAVAPTGADLGIALDGDGDRLIMVDRRRCRV